MELETLDYLLSNEGDNLLDIARSMDGSFLAKLTTLRKKYPAQIASAALELIELRKRASKKFSLADQMFFTKEALEQSSGEMISGYRAERFYNESSVLDLACGIGGDTIGLASRCYVTAVDIDPVRIRMAERNIEIYGLSDRVNFICDDVTNIPLIADAAFIDPSRRTDGKRTTRLSQMSPSVDFIYKLVHSIPDCGVKLSPATDDEELDSLEAEIEFINDSGECKEALAWFGNFKHDIKSVVILPQKTRMSFQAVNRIPVSTPGEYIYEPAACVIRAHMVEQLASEIGAWKIDEKIAYLSSHTVTKTPFAVSYKVIQSFPFNIKELNRQLNKLDIGNVIIKKRGIPFEPEDIMRKLKLTGKLEAILILTKVNDRIWTFVCQLSDDTCSYSISDQKST